MNLGNFLIEKVSDYDVELPYTGFVINKILIYNLKNEEKEIELRFIDKSLYVKGDYVDLELDDKGLLRISGDNGIIQISKGKYSFSKMKNINNQELLGDL